MKFLADENFPSASIKLLEDAGHQVVDIKKTQPGISDIAILNLPSYQDFILLTFDKDLGNYFLTWRKFIWHYCVSLRFF